VGLSVGVRVLGLVEGVNDGIKLGEVEGKVLGFMDGL